MFSHRQRNTKYIKIENAHKEESGILLLYLVCYHNLFHYQLAFYPYSRCWQCLVFLKTQSIVYWDFIVFKYIIMKCEHLLWIKRWKYMSIVVFPSLIKLLSVILGVNLYSISMYNYKIQSLVQHRGWKILLKFRWIVIPRLQNSHNDR